MDNYRIPTITVLMPVYNCELYIREAVESILNQTFRDFEFLIIDDFSTDTTLQICKSFQDDRIVIIEKEKNSGYTNSLNYGLSIAKGKYIARMDGDDISLPERFAKQVAFMEANDNVVVCGTTFSVIGTGSLIYVPETHDQIVTGMLQECKIAHPSVMLRNIVFVENNIIYDTHLEPAEDYALWVQLVGFGKLHNLQECLLQYRVHDAQVSSFRNEKQIESAKQTRLKLLSYLNVAISKEQQEVYLKVINPSAKLNLEEFFIFFNLKTKMIKANNSFFNDDIFKKYWIQLESKFISYYFKNRNSYSLNILKDYITVFTKIDSKLKFKDFTKLVVKSIINHKVK